MSYEDMDADITFLEGVRGRFDRVPQRERKGIVSAPVEEGQKTFQKTILVITQLEKAAKAAGKGKAAAAKTNAKAAANGAGDEDFNERVHDAIVAALNAARRTSTARRSRRRWRCSTTRTSSPARKASPTTTKRIPWPSSKDIVSSK
jgi:hypothetical protein